MDTIRGTSFARHPEIANLLAPETREAYLARFNTRGDSGLGESVKPRGGTSGGRLNGISQTYESGRRPSRKRRQSVEDVDEVIDRLAAEWSLPAPASPAPPSAECSSSASAAAAVLLSHPNYDVLGEIGRSQFAIVYEAYERALRRYVAIKQLEEKFQGDPRQNELFWTEARFLAGLEHENIVRIYGVDQQRRWIITELMRGSLDVRLAERPLPPELVRSVVRQALEGLRYLHGRGKIHGEVKPSKLLIDDEGRVKLSASPGFSVRGEFRCPSSAQRQVAPELLNPEVFGEVGPGVDLYCLGFTALELLKGSSFHSLFKGVAENGSDANLAWMRWHSSPTEKLPPVQELVPDVPDDLGWVIDRLLNKMVAQRYRSAAQALADLEDKPIIRVDVLQKPSSPEPADLAPSGARHIGMPPVFELARPSIVDRDDVPTDKLSGMLTRLRDEKYRNELLKKPAVLYAILGILLLMALLIVATPGPGSPKPEIPRDEDDPAPPLPKGFASLRPRDQLPIENEHVHPNFNVEEAPVVAKRPVITAARDIGIPNNNPIAQPAVPQDSREVPETIKPLTPARRKPAPPSAVSRVSLPPHLTPAEVDRYIEAIGRIVNDDGKDLNAKSGTAAFRIATDIYPAGPHAYLAFGMLLERLQRPGEALDQYQESVLRAKELVRISLERKRDQGVSLRGWRHLIRLRICLEKDYGRAASDCVELVENIDALDESDLDLDPLKRDEIAQDVFFAGAVMGYLGGPANRRTRRNMVVDEYNRCIEGLLSSTLRETFADARNAIEQQYKVELAVVKESRQQHADDVREKRESGELPTTSIAINTTIQSYKQREYGRDNIRKGIGVTEREEELRDEMTKEGNGKNGWPFGKPGKSDAREITNSGRRRTTEMTRETTFRRSDEPPFYHSEAPYGFTTYLPKNLVFEGRRLLDSLKRSESNT